jgi:hypothetical protein
MKLLIGITPSFQMEPHTVIWIMMGFRFNVTIWKLCISEKAKQSFYKSKTKGEGQNKFVGSVELFSERNHETRINTIQRFSVSIDVMTFGIGTKKIDSIQVTPNSKFQTLVIQHLI